MSTSEPEFHPDDFEGLTPREVAIHPAELRKLRKAEKEREELKAQLAEFQRRETFARAGIPLDDPAAKYFIKGYDGELTPEAIKAAAVEAKVISGDQPTAAEIAGHTNAAAAAAGADPVGLGPNLEAQLAELRNKRFAPGDDMARSDAINQIARLAKEGNIRIPLT